MEIGNAAAAAPLTIVAQFDGGSIQSFEALRESVVLGNMLGGSKRVRNVELGHYAEAFAEIALEWDDLTDLDHEVLKDIGVSAAGYRLKLLRTIKSLTTEPAPSSFARLSTPRVSGTGSERGAAPSHSLL